MDDDSIDDPLPAADDDALCITVVSHCEAVQTEDTDDPLDPISLSELRGARELETFDENDDEPDPKEPLPEKSDDVPDAEVPGDDESELFELLLCSEVELSCSIRGSKSISAPEETLFSASIDWRVNE